MEERRVLAFKEAYKGLILGVKTAWFLKSIIKWTYMYELVINFFKKWLNGLGLFLEMIIKVAMLKKVFIVFIKSLGNPYCYYD